MATTNLGDKLVTTSEVKIVNNELKARIQAAETELSDYINSQVRFDTINGKPVLIIPERRNENGN